MAKGIVNPAVVPFKKSDPAMKSKAATKPNKPNVAAMSALFGKKATKPTVQSVPTKAASL